jgi:hypothetical protein
MMRHNLWTVLLILALLLAGCGGDDDNDKKDGDDESAPDGSAPASADLSVSNIELDPTSITTGTTFVIKVYVENIGGAASGEYDLTINLRDVTRGTTSPIGTLKGQSVAAGQEVLAYTTGQRQLFEAGSFQVQVILTPAGSDAGANNNRRSLAFTVN